MASLRVLRTIATILLCLVVLGGIQDSHAVPERPSASTNSTALSSLQFAPGRPCLSPSQADISTAQYRPAPQNVSIPGHVVPDVLSGEAFQKGILPISTVLHLELVLALRNPTAFNQCLASLSNPASPNYEHFLNATTLQPYVPTPGQRQSMTDFLEKAGFTVSYGPSPIVFQLTGTVSAVSRTFGTRLRLYQQGSSLFYSPDTEPKLPQNLAALTNAITGLDNFSLIRPAESPCSGPYCPQGLQIGYGLSNLFSSGYNGTGQEVAIVDAPGESNTQAAIDTFSSQYGLPSVTLDIRYPDGKPSSWNTGWAAEAAMDVEAVHSVAPGAGIVLLYDTDLMNAVDYVATNHLATIVSNSWTYICNSNICSDTELPSDLVSSVDSTLAIDAAQGLTILFASGDDGAKPDEKNLGTEFPASDPNVLAVAATNLALNGCGQITCSGYGRETGASISGGGYSGYFPEPSWQTSAIGVTPSGKGGHGRGIPDVSMFGFSPFFWVYSTTTNVCTGGGSSAGWFACAGTSLSTPLWAGFLAVALQVRGGVSFGNISPRLYQLASSLAYSSGFHDITSGSNGYYSAATGWDPVTGWGSPIANMLALALSVISQSTLGLSAIQANVIGAAANTVWFVLPDYTGPYHTPASKCGGVTAARLSDYSAGGYVLGLLSNQQNEYLDTSSSISQTTCGSPTGISGAIVTLAGPGVSAVVHYYEQVAGITPVYYLWDGVRNNFVVRAGGVKYTVPNAGGNTAPGDDLFLIEAFTDSQGRSVFVLYGFSWQGTLAAGVFFASYVYPQLQQFPNAWYIYRWIDAGSGTSANKFPDPGDRYTLIATSGSAPSLSSTSVPASGTAYSGFAGIGTDVFGASQGSVYFILPDYTGPYHTSSAKCGSRNAASLSDYSAGGYILSADSNIQNQVLDTGSSVNSTSGSCGQFLGSTPTTLVTVAGPGVNTALYYYEQTSATTPVYYLWDGVRNNFVVRATSARYTVSAGNTVAGDDLFLLEQFTDSQGRHVYVIYGFSWQGTLAGATYLNTYVRSHLSSFTNSWYIYEWKDAKSGASANSFPDYGDQFNQLATG